VDWRRFGTIKMMNIRLQ